MSNARSVTKDGGKVARQKAAAKFLGLKNDRTIRKWIDRGFPIDGTEVEWRAWREEWRPRKSSAVKALSETARLRRAQADLAEIDAAKKSGEVYEREDVEAANARALAILRSGVRSLGARMASTLAVMTDPAEIKAYVGRECDAILTATATALQAWVAGELGKASGATPPVAGEDGGPVG